MVPLPLEPAPLSYRLVEGAKPDDCLTLTRLWLSDRLPRNSESRALGLTLKALRRNTTVKFLVSYAYPGLGHIGFVYQATGWVYTGLSSARPFTTSEMAFHITHGRSPMRWAATASDSGESMVSRVKIVPQFAKHRYIYFLDPILGPRLAVTALPYPKKEEHKWK